MHNINIWGNNTWIFFHAIAEKIKPEYFDQEISNLLSIIMTICSNLPCPECSNDAVNRLKKCNFNNIKSKEDFKRFIFFFHNSINNKLNYNTFKESELSKYKNCNLNIILNNMFKIYNSNYSINAPKMIIHSFHRKNMIYQVMKYFNNNKHKFYP